METLSIQTLSFGAGREDVLFSFVWFFLVV